MTLFKTSACERFVHQQKHMYLHHLWTNRRTHLQRRRGSWRRWGCRDGRGMGFSPYFKVHCSCPSNKLCEKLHFTVYNNLKIDIVWIFISLFKEKCLLCWCCDYWPACDLGQTCLNLFQVNSSGGLDLIFAVFILPAIHIQCLFPKHIFFLMLCFA